jgi:hypothetical protein
MTKSLATLCLLTWLVSVAGAAGAQTPGQPAAAAKENAPTKYAQWKNSFPSDPGFFPIAVWLQDPRNAARYKEAGVNTYVALWKGPTEAQLTQLKAAGMFLVCEQSKTALANKDNPLIVGWMHGDEPDNAQAKQGGGYGPPVPPEKIAADYQKLKQADPTRPVMLNLGQGVAWDRWYGRGVRTNKPEDYPQYMAGGDIISFDIYPVAHNSPEVRNQLWFVARGVERLSKWSEGRKIVWNCLECTYIGDDQKAGPRQIRAEAWMAIVHGSTGFIWFVHEFKPKFKEAAILEDLTNLAAVTAVNKEVAGLAAVINSPAIEGAKVESSNKEVPVAITARRHGGATYVFAVAMRDGKTKAAFRLAGISGAAKAQVLGENRQISVADGRFEDSFGGYDVHLYRIDEKK